MDFSSYKTLALARNGRVLEATFNSPETLNAVSPEMESEMIRFFSEATYDEETHAIMITGAGRAFSAGGSIEFMQKGLEDPNIMYNYIPRSKQLVASVIDCPKPVVAKVNGPAIGFGATLALFCDIAVATEDAVFSDPHVQVGFVAGDGGSAIWPQLIGYMRAKQYLLLGDSLTGKEAAEIGLITRAVPADELDAVADDFAQRLANGASKAVQWTKLAINIGLKQVAASIMDASMAYEALSNQTIDHKEAVDAFAEKRKPKFIGK